MTRTAHRAKTHDRAHVPARRCASQSLRRRASRTPSLQAEGQAYSSGATIVARIIGSSTLATLRRPPGSGKSAGLSIVFCVPSLKVTGAGHNAGPNKVRHPARAAMLDRAKLTAHGHERPRNDHLLVKLVLEALPKHIHMQGPVEPEAEPLPEKARRLAADGDGPVRQGQPADCVLEAVEPARVERVDTRKDHGFGRLEGLERRHGRTRQVEGVAEER